MPWIFCESSTMPDYHTCTIAGCGNEYCDARHELGYRTCLNHWSRDPKNAMPGLVLMDVNKSNPTITRSPQGFVSDQYASRPVTSELRQTRAYINLQSKEPRHHE